MPLGSTRLDSNIISGLKHTDPKLYQYLMTITDTLNKVQNELDPLVAGSLAEAIAAVTPDDVENFTYTLQSNGVRFDWSPIDDALQYEIRVGVSWEAGSHVEVTPTNVAIINPILVGTTKYWIKAFTSGGLESANATFVSVVVPPLGTITITTRVIDNNVLLNWSAPTSSFTIDYYKLYKGGVLTGTIRGTFTAFFESVGGTFIYGVEAIDIAGNSSGIFNVTLVVSPPPDYVLTDSRVSALNGTKINVKRELNGVTPRLICCINTTETYGFHFSSRGWANPAAQVAAGYPIYIEPAQTTGSYVETVDYGVTFGSIIVNIDWSITVISGTVTATSSIELSTDGISWGSPISGQSAFGTNVRYIRITITFTGATDKSLIWFYNLQFFLDVKREMDSGNLTANAADSGGTTVTFNKAFKSVDSITLVSQSLEPIYPIYDFVNIPNPTTFKVLIFDSAGQRITYPVSWKARGIV